MAQKKQQQQTIPSDDVQTASAASGKAAVVDALGIPAVDAVAAPKARHVIAPDQLAPKPQTFVEAQRFWYWFGIMPDCPVEGIGAAGMTFQKVQEEVIPGNSRNGGRTQRVPIIGGIARLNRDTMLRLLNVLPRIVIRMQEEAGEVEEPRTGVNVGDAFKQPKRGRLITIPKDPSKARVPYIPSPKDVPASGFMFLQLCADQRNGSRGTTYPDPLSQTGLEWPGDEPLQ